MPKTLTLPSKCKSTAGKQAQFVPFHLVMLDKDMVMDFKALSLELYLSETRVWYLAHPGDATCAVL